MTCSIALTALEDAPQQGPLSTGSSAPQLEDPPVTLRFRLTASDGASLEALRYARRSVLREERTLGVDEGEPLLEEADFSATEIRWRVPAAARRRCLEKLAGLVERANRTLEQAASEAFAPGAKMRREP
jgi:hypothetical protein